MRLHLCAVGTRVPAWVEAGYRDYADRLRGQHRLELLTVPAADRKNQKGAAAWQAWEGERLRAAAPPGTAVVLDERGSSLTTRALAEQLERWALAGAPVTFFVGGADGLDAGLKAEAAFSWSLSPLTLPHALVRVVVAEALYRSVSLLEGHPYHRGE
jgi:23S rRNA (pseudouridine1915-N3)-methyltransferase